MPHTYRSLNGRKGTNDGYPIDYEMNTIEEEELYDLKLDPEEKNNIAAQHPDVVLKINAIADSIRLVLGDRLTGIKGNEARPVGLAASKVEN